MCIICVEFEKGKLKLGEAVRNYGEMKDTLTPEHQKEIEETLFNNFPFYPPEHDDYWETTGFGD
jgi:hypothetical protein